MGTPHFYSLRWRLSAAISGVALLCAAACVVVGVVFLRQALTDRARMDVQRTLDGVIGYMNVQRGDLSGIAELIAADPAVASAARSGSQQALSNHLALYYTDLGANVLDVVDRRGRVLAHMESVANPQAYGSVGRTWPSVRAALSGQEVTAVDTDTPRRASADGYALRATVPLYDGSQIVGAVVVGRQLDSLFASRIGTALNATVNLIAGSQQAGSTQTYDNGLFTTTPAVSHATMARIARGKPSIAEVHESGHAVLSGLVPLAGSEGAPTAAVEVVSRLDPLYNVVTQLSLLVLALGVAVVAMGVVLAWGISRRLTARLRQLEAAAAFVATQAGRGSVATTGTPLRELQVAIAVRGRDEVASLARSFGTMIHALDERMGANARLAAQIVGLYFAAQARVRELTGLAEIARLLTAGSSLQQTLDELGAQVCRLVGCAAVAIVVHGESTAPTVIGGAGLPEGYAAIMHAELGASSEDGFQTVPQMAISRGEVAWRRMADLPERQEALRRLAELAGWGGIIAVPLRIQERSVGALACYTSADVPPAPSDLSLLATIAGQVAVVAENARLQAQARDLVAVEERQRLARELHDSVSQALYGIVLGARTARTLAERDPSRITDPLDYVLSLSEAALTEMRALIFELRPEALASEGLIAALEKQAAFVRARHGIEASVVAGAEPAAPYEIKEALYRIGQEALHNTVKHAHATRAEVRLADSGAALTLEVCDDGTGFDPQQAFPGHLGLHSMRERARRLGGTLDVESALERGTRIRVAIPTRVVSLT